MSTTVSLITKDFFDGQELKISIDFLDRLIIDTEFRGNVVLSSINAFELALWIIRNIKINLPDE